MISAPHQGEQQHSRMLIFIPWRANRAEGVSLTLTSSTTLSSSLTLTTTIFKENNSIHNFSIGIRRNSELPPILNASILKTLEGNNFFLSTLQEERYINIGLSENVAKQR